MTRRSSPSVSPEMAGHIKFLVKVKGLYQHQAAALLNLNQGRVSEVIRGKRYPDAPAIRGPFPA